MMKLINFSILLMIYSLIFFFFSLYFLMFKLTMIMEWNIFNLNSMKMNFIIYLDYKSMMFMFLVSIISSMIFIYSIKYMDLSNNLIKKFYYLMMLFLISMYFLIISCNMLTILIGWDGLGLISYCLIIYYQKMKSFNAGMMTIILNRLGDCALLMFMSMMLMFGSWNLLLYKMNLIMMLMFIIMIFTKSAQIPFCNWLPMAMMAPTPVSSLVHSSTLVTAGVYLMIRYVDLLEIKLKNLILLIFSLTMLFSGILANFEMDIKKIIAFSTLSQLSFMMSILIMNLKEMAFLHLFIHAMFKSLMFMCVGSYIHYLNNNQNIKFYNGMFYIYPLKSLIFIFSLFSLMGFPFLVGFYSKDLMIENYFISKMNFISILFLFLSTILTMTYSFRIIFILMNWNMFLNMIYKIEDNLMSYCMIFLMILSIILSKFLYNLIINLEIFINFFLKIMIFKMFMISMLMNIMIYNLLIIKKVMKFFNNFMNMNLIYKNNYLMFYLIDIYDIMIEKTLYELMGKNFFKFIFYIKIYNKKLLMNELFSMYIMIMLFMLMLIKLI